MVAGVNLSLIWLAIECIALLFFLFGVYAVLVKPDIDQT